MSIVTNQLLFPQNLPIDIQIEIGTFLPDFIPWSLTAHQVGFRRFTFYNLPKGLTLQGPPMIVDDLRLMKSLNKLSPLLKTPVIFEKTKGHVLLEKLSGYTWGKINTKKSLTIIHLNEFWIPSEIGQLQNIRTIEIKNSFCKIRIPSRIGKLTNLKHLICLFNDESVVIPPQIKFLVNLEILYIKTDNVPPEISELKRLTDLHIQGGNILELPELVLPELENLTICQTSMGGCVPKWISRLPMLRELDLRENRFVDICRITHELNFFSIKDNCIEELPRDFGWWFNSRHIDISGNLIEELPESFAYLSTMSQCVLYGNPLRVIPRGMIMLERTCNFVIDNNCGDDETKLSEQDKLFLNSCYNDNLAYQWS